MTEKNNTLMRKTKQELVNIILRKDDIADKLQKELEGLQRIIRTKSNSIDSKDERIIRLKEEITKLNNVIKSRIEILDNTRKDVINKTAEIAELNAQLNDIKDGCDEYATRFVELTNRNKQLKLKNTIIIIIAIVAIIISIGLYINM